MKYIRIVTIVDSTRNEGASANVVQTNLKSDFRWKLADLKTSDLGGKAVRRLQSMYNDKGTCFN